MSSEVENIIVQKIDRTDSKIDGLTEIMTKMREDMASTKVRITTLENYTKKIDPLTNRVETLEKEKAKIHAIWATITTGVTAAWAWLTHGKN